MKLPRDLSGQRVVRALKRSGFVEERQEGSHIRLMLASCHRACTSGPCAKDLAEHSAASTN